MTTFLTILFLVLAIGCAIVSMVFSNREFVNATIAGTLVFGVIAGFLINKVSIEQEPSALDVYRGKTELLVPIEEGDTDSVVVWKNEVK